MTQNVPRWDRPDDYKYTDSHTIRDWGWEFIRRNPKYIAEWEKNLKIFHEEKELYEIELDGFFNIDPAQLSSIRAEKASKKEDLYYKEAIEKGLKREEAKLYSNRVRRELESKTIEKELEKRAQIYKKKYNLTNPDEFETFELVSGFASRWGLTTYQDPRAKKLTGCNLLDRDIHVYASFQPGLYFYKIAMKQGECIAKFDLKLPLPSQLEIIQARAEAIKKSSEYKKINKKDIVEKSKIDIPIGMWKLYIRCLDINELVKRKEIKRAQVGEKLFSPTNQTTVVQWDDAIKAANKMVSTRYRRLMF